MLTQLSRFWFDRLDVPNHLLSCDVDEFDLPAGIDREPLDGRSMLVRKTEVVPIECVVRGYLSGSGWKEYQQTSAVCGIALPPGLRESDQLPEPIFTPATKADVGEHDVNITFDETCERDRPRAGRRAAPPQPRDLQARRRLRPERAASSSPTRSSSSARSTAS